MNQSLNWLPDAAATRWEPLGTAMRAGLHAALACDGLTLITAGNYGGKLGHHHFPLRELLE